MAQKTWQSINQKIQKGEAIVLTAEEVSQMGKDCSPEEIFHEVDVVTTGTFGAMCSSGAFLNFGHPNPPIKMEEIYLNQVPAYGGLAAVDTYIGAAAQRQDGEGYGGAHVIEDLVKGKEVILQGKGKGTHCYPRKNIETLIHKDSLNEMILFNPRNAYQNYAAAANTSDKDLYTYMGVLGKQLGNVTYSTAGELSPLLNEKEMNTIGMGSKIFLAGAEGYVSWHGTQFNTEQEKNNHGVPLGPGATLAVIGDMKKMDAKWLRAAYYYGYGPTLFVGIGIPIPIINEDIAKAVSIRNEEIETKILDYGNGKQCLGTANYKELQSGSITIKGQKISTAPLSSLHKARLIAGELKTLIQNGEFTLTEPVTRFPKARVNPLPIVNHNSHHRPYGTHKTGRKGIHIRWDDCIHCGACTAVCHSALTLTSTQLLAYDEEKCTQCRKCIKACPLQVIESSHVL